MTTECRWIESRVEDLFSDDPRVRHDIDEHLASCSPCRCEVEAHQDLDRLLASYFNARMNHRGIGDRHKPRLLVAAAAVTAVALAAWVGVSYEPPGSTVSDAPTLSAAPGVGTGVSGLAKPSESGPASAADPGDGLSATASEADFYVVDAAGYAYTSEDLGGSTLVIGVFDSTGIGGEEFGQLYEAIPAQPDLRFIAVFHEGTDTAVLRGVPIMMNRGSTLFGTAPGEFIILNEDGAVFERGTLTDPRLEETVRAGLAALRAESETP